jgi:hypothetical protein
MVSTLHLAPLSIAQKLKKRVDFASNATETTRDAVEQEEDEQDVVETVEGDQLASPVHPIKKRKHNAVKEPDSPSRKLAKQAKLAWKDTGANFASGSGEIKSKSASAEPVTPGAKQPASLYSTHHHNLTNQLPQTERPRSKNSSTILVKRQRQIESLSRSNRNRLFLRSSKPLASKTHNLRIRR